MIKWFDANKTGKEVSTVHLGQQYGRIANIETVYLNGVVYRNPTVRREYVGSPNKALNKTFTVLKSGSFKIVCVGAGGNYVTVGDNQNCAGGGSGSCSIATVSISTGQVVNVSIDRGTTQVTVAGTTVCSAKGGGNASASGTSVTAGTGASTTGAVGASKFPGKNGTKGVIYEERGMGELICSGGAYANADYPYGCGLGVRWNECGYVWVEDVSQYADEHQGYVLIQRV